MIPRILSEVLLNEAAVRKLEVLPNITVLQLSPHDSSWDLPDDLLPGPEILLCKFPPRNLDALNLLKVVQLPPVAYEHWRDLLDPVAMPKPRSLVRLRINETLAT